MVAGVAKHLSSSSRTSGLDESCHGHQSSRGTPWTSGALTLERQDSSSVEQGQGGPEGGAGSGWIT